jgi:pSer/pThr/pTyr-binding forkhead associated (FHA) protein
MISLRVRAPDGSMKRIPLGVTPKVVGRDEEADIIIEQSGVSRRHCSVAGLPNGLRVQDLGSTNGTWVNGKRVNSAILKNGDRLQIGDVVFIAECETPVGFGTTIRRVEEQFAFGKGFRTILGEIAAEGKTGQAANRPTVPDERIKKKTDAGHPK